MGVRTPKHYTQLIGGEIALPSWVSALLPDGTGVPTVVEVLERLENGQLQAEFVRVSAKPENDLARWQIEIDLQLPNEPEKRLMKVWMQHSDRLDREHLEWAGMNDSDVLAAQASDWALGVSSELGQNPLEDYFAQLNLLALVAPNPVAILDMAACRPHPGAWLKDVTATHIPPSPSTLYSIHAVYDEEEPSRGAWLHTHGLLRCGCIELEILDAPTEHTSVLGELLNATAAMFIESGPPQPGEPFWVGQGIQLVWLPWEEGVKSAKRKALGTNDDRDEFHNHPSGILVAPKRGLSRFIPGRTKNPSVFVPILNDNPILYVSSMETERMSLLARDRIRTFAELHDRFGETEDWAFLVKLGYQVDHAESEDEREHLWFEVHSVAEDRVDATLMNEPYGLAEMHEGQRDSHPLDLLTDWSVFSPHGRFDPETAVHLLRILDEEN